MPLAATSGYVARYQCEENIALGSRPSYAPRVAYSHIASTPAPDTPGYAPRYQSGSNRPAARTSSHGVPRHQSGARDRIRRRAAPATRRTLDRIVIATAPTPPG